MIRRRRLAPLLLLAACAPPPPPPPAVLTLEMEGGADQNPEAAGDGGARPVAVQLTYLTATARFERADVFALTERDTLGTDSAGSEQFVLAPGERRTVTRELKPGVQALGVVALFRDVDAGATWRALAPVAPHGPTRLALRTERNRVLLAPAAAPAR